MNLKVVGSIPLETIKFSIRGLKFFCCLKKIHKNYLIIIWVFRNIQGFSIGGYNHIISAGELLIQLTTDSSKSGEVENKKYSKENGKMTVTRRLKSLWSGAKRLLDALWSFVASVVFEKQAKKFPLWAMKITIRRRVQEEFWEKSKLPFILVIIWTIYRENRKKDPQVIMNV